MTLTKDETEVVEHALRLIETGQADSLDGALIIALTEICIGPTEDKDIKRAAWELLDKIVVLVNQSPYRDGLLRKLLFGYYGDVHAIDQRFALYIALNKDINRLDDDSDDEPDG